MPMQFHARKFSNLSFPDVDECAENTHDCGENAVCINELYIYSCECAEGFRGDGYECTGWGLDSFKSQKLGQILGASQPEFCCSLWSLDIDECEKEDACAELATCINLPGSYDCECPLNVPGDGFTECIGWSNSLLRKSLLCYALTNMEKC